MYNTGVTIFCICLKVMHVVYGVTVVEYKNLRESLLANYSTSIRPVLDQDDTVYVFTAFWLVDINEVDVVSQNLLTTAHLELAWTDELLQWNPDTTGIYTMYFKQVRVCQNNFNRSKFTVLFLLSLMSP